MFCYRCGKKLQENEIYYSKCGFRRFHNYQKEPMALGSSLSEEQAIRYYLNVGYSCNSITIFLNLYHDVSISIRALKKNSGITVVKRKQMVFIKNIVRCTIER